jgi:ATP-dependent Lon protease
MPLLIGRAGSLAAVEQAGDDGYLLVVAQRDPETPEPAAGDLHRIGTIVRVRQRTPVAKGTTRVLLEGIARARVTRFGTRSGAIRAHIEPHPLDAGVTPSALEGLEALGRRMATLFEEYVGLHRRWPAEVAALAQTEGSIERRACAVAAHLAVRHDVRQEFLEA